MMNKVLTIEKMQLPGLPAGSEYIQVKNTRELEKTRCSEATTAKLRDIRFRALCYRLKNCSLIKSRPTSGDTLRHILTINVNWFTVCAVKIMRSEPCMASKSVLSRFRENSYPVVLSIFHYLTTLLNPKTFQVDNKLARIMYVIYNICCLNVYSARNRGGVYPVSQGIFRELRARS
jgi:hypothetical protein